MYVAHFHSEVFQQVVSRLRAQWPAYRIVGVVEEIDKTIKSDLLRRGFWQGHYKDFDVVWRVDLEQMALDNGGPKFLHVSVHPMLEVAYASMDDGFEISVSFRHFTPQLKRPTISQHSTGAEIWDLAYFYDADLVDLEPKVGSGGR